MLTLLLLLIVKNPVLLYLSETHGIQQKNISPISSTPRADSPSYSRGEIQALRSQTTIRRYSIHRCAAKGVDNAMSCHRTGYDRLRQAQHTHGNNSDALKERQ